MPARCTTWLTPSSSGDQSTGAREVGQGDALDAVRSPGSPQDRAPRPAPPSRSLASARDQALADEARGAGDEHGPFALHLAPRAKR